MLNEVNIDYRVLGLPQSVVKQAENSRVRVLVKKIENHPHRHSLQRDLLPCRLKTEVLLAGSCDQVLSKYTPCSL